MSRFAPLRRFWLFVLDCFLDWRARLIERRDLFEQHRHEIDAIHELHRRREAELLSQISLKDREIRFLAAANQEQHAYIEKHVALHARAAEDAKHFPPASVR